MVDGEVRARGPLISLVAAGFISLCILHPQLLFVQLSGAAVSRLRPPRLRTPVQVHHSAPEPFAASVPSVLSLAVIVAVVGRRVTAASVVRHAKAGKKKGVRVVDGREIPWNLFGPKAPYRAKVVNNHDRPRTLTRPNGEPNWETGHVTFEHGGNMPYVEGQSIGVIAPGPDKRGEKPAKVRLYSIASSATGDDETSSTVSLCVKRLVEVGGQYENRGIGEDQPDLAGTSFNDKPVYRGVSSNYLCDLVPGDEVLLTGPTGAEMLLPGNPEANILMLATGTGIAPMRGFLRLLFHDQAGASDDGSRIFKGLAWLFLGVPNQTSLLYDSEHVEYKRKFPDQFRYNYAISREETDADGKKMYVHTKMAEYANELWLLMQDPNTHVYVCGLKGMEQGLDECFDPIAEKSGTSWEQFAKSMKTDRRYHVEVY